MLGLNERKLGVVALALTALSGLAFGQVAPKATTPGKPTADQAALGKSLIRKSMAKFTENKGQWDSKAQFLARTPGMNFWLAQDGIVLDYYQADQEKGSNAGHALKLRFLNSSKLVAKGQNRQRGTSDYLPQADGKGAYGVASYGSVTASNLYPKVDLKTYLDKDGQPRYDFIVAPNGDPSSIRMKFDGVKNVKVDAKGNLEFNTRVGKRQVGSLFAYQMVGSKKVQVPAKFEVTDGQIVAVKLGAYDRSKQLVIDPLIYGSYYGGDKNFDMVKAIAADEEGGVYLTGGTRSAIFPIIYGPYTFNYSGGWDAFVSKFQGDAYYHDYAAFVPGSFDEFGDKIAVDSAGNVWVAGRTTSPNFPGNQKDNVHYIRQRALFPGHNINGGQFVINVSNLTRAARTPVAWNASAATIQAVIENDYPASVGHVRVTGTPPSDNPDGWRVAFDKEFVVRVTVTDTAIGNGLISEGLQPHTVINVAGAPSQQELRHIGSFYAGFGYGFTLTFNGQTTGVLGPNASAAAVRNALDALTSTADNETFATGGSLWNAPINISFTGATGLAATPIIVTEVNQPRDNHYAVDKPYDVWLMRFAKDGAFVLNPKDGAGNPVVFHTDGEGTEGISALSILPVENATASTPVRLVLGGSVDRAINQIPSAYNGEGGFFLTVDYAAGAFTVRPALTKYIGANGNASANVKGAVIDAEGSIYIAGTLFASGNSDTSASNPVFQTTPGVWAEGRLQRGNDMYVRKYLSDGSLSYSTLVGGNDTETAAGDVDQEVLDTFLRVREPGGSCLAVDASGNAYVLGTSFSFNYPRTRGVYGEVFSGSATQVVVTKLNRDASALLYSTNLRTANSVQPIGIAVDGRGQAYVTGTATVAQFVFANPLPDPVQPDTDLAIGSVPTTPDAERPAYVSPTQPELHTRDGWFLVLNPAATNLVFGTYVGGDLNDQIFAPYADKFGDVWVMGWTETYRRYTRVSSTGTVTVYERNANMTPFITSLAFKQATDPGPPGGVSDITYLIDQPELPLTIGSTSIRDGFVLKYRLGLPVLASVTLNPAELPGGDPSGGTNHPSTIGTVTLSSAAPAGGVTINLSLDNTSAASFSSVDSQNSATITIGAGATTGNFTVYSRAVIAPATVNIKADYEGNFKIVKLGVAPWLQQLTISPTSVVGGGTVVGRVRLVTVAPAGGVLVPLSTDTSGLLTVPANVVVPAGQDTATFNIGTVGVSASSQAPVTASLLGVGLSQLVTINPASLVSLTFAPDRVAAESASTGTITLDGVAGDPFSVTVTVNGSPAGYSVSPATVNFARGQKSATFRLTTGPEAASVTRRVTANRAAQGNYSAQQVSGTIFVDASNVTSLTLTPNAVDGGSSSVGRVTISAPAPSGGTIVRLSSSNTTAATVPASLTVPAGATSAQFTVSTKPNAAQLVSIIRAYRGTLGTPSYSFKTAQITVRKLDFTFTLNPVELVGGLATSTGTVTLSGRAPAGGIKATLTNSNPSAASMPASVTVAAGQTSATFLIRTSLVESDTTAIIRAQIGSAVKGVVLRIKTFGLASITFTPNSILSGGKTTMKITLDAPAPAGGAVIQLDPGINSQIINLPATVTIPAGQKVFSGIYTGKPVSRPLSTLVTALFRNKTVSAVLTVKPANP